MRTTITIPNAVMEDVAQYTHAETRTDAINLALQEWVRLKKIQAIKQLQGQIDIEDNLQQVRHAEIQELEEIK